MLLHYLVLVLSLQVIEGQFSRKTITPLEEIGKKIHLKLFVIVVMIRVTLGLFFILETLKFQIEK